MKRDSLNQTVAKIRARVEELAMEQECLREQDRQELRRLRDEAVRQLDRLHRMVAA